MKRYVSLSYFRPRQGVRKGALATCSQDADRSRGEGPQRRAYNHMIRHVASSDAPEDRWSLEPVGRPPLCWGSVETSQVRSQRVFEVSKRARRLIRTKRGNPWRFLEQPA